MTAMPMETMYVEIFYSCVLLTATVPAATVLRCTCNCYLGEQSYSSNIIIAVLLFTAVIFMATMPMATMPMAVMHRYTCKWYLAIFFTAAVFLTVAFTYSSNVPYSCIYIQQQCYLQQHVHTTAVLLYSNIYLQQPSSLWQKIITVAMLLTEAITFSSIVHG